ncbi:hypothetical protein SDC9_163008 [bioreactor metagenome]|uniref:Uncharacterized protein n=1 Tax=bioreactor metagenome TaxID=1076179 RepID=A0A645FUK2_9ZZZZ
MLRCFGKDRGFFHLVAKKQPERSDHQATDEKRHAPTPGFHLGRSQCIGEHRRTCRAQQRAEDHAALLKAAVQPTPARRRPLQQEGHGIAQFTTGREALKQAPDDQKNRRRYADGGIARRDAHDQRANAHQRHGDQQCQLAPTRVAQAAEDDGAQGAGDEAHAEHGKRAQQRQRVVSRREEVASDHRRQKRIGGKVEPLQRVADHGADDGMCTRRGAGGFRLLSGTHGRRGDGTHSFNS